MYRTRSFAAGFSFFAACTILGTLCPLVSRELQAQEKVGYVLDMRGCWSVSHDSKCLHRGDLVTAGALLRNAAAKPSDGDRIVIADMKGDVIKRIRCRSSICNECRTSGTCYDPIQPLPRLGPPPSALSAGFQGLMALFSSRPERFSVHRVRAETPTDIVAQISGDRISLAQVLEGLKSGRYTAIFTQIASPSNSSNWKSAPFVVDAEHIDVNQTVMGLHPGLFEVTLEDADSSMSFWVLLVDPEQYPKLNDEFHQVSSVIDAWGDDIPGDLKDSYKRAYLAFLNRQIDAKSAKRTR